MKKTQREKTLKGKTQRGFTLLEMLACLLVAGLMLQVLSGMWRESMRLSEAAGTGKSLEQAFRAGHSPL